MIPVVSLIIFFTCMSILLFIFIPKVISQRNFERERNARGNGHSSILTRKYLESRARSSMAESQCYGIERGSDTSGLQIEKLIKRKVEVSSKADVSSVEHEGKDEEEKVEITADKKSVDGIDGEVRRRETTASNSDINLTRKVDAPSNEYDGANENEEEKVEIASDEN